jgi:DNA-binding MarR family transcriptional regulator
MSRLVRALENDGLVRRQGDPDDARVARFTATSKGVRLLEAGRARRVESLANALSALSRAERDTLEAGVDVLDRVVAFLRVGK